LGERLGETRAAIVQAMLENPKISAKKLSDILGISMTAVEKNIRHLKSQGYVKRVRPAKGGYWEVLK
jgi:ATP-dependent DNA helicase RecG